MLPFILHEEVARIKEEIVGEKKYEFGTTHVAEAFVILVRFITDDWLIKQRVCGLKLLAKSLTGEDVARLLIETLSTELGIASNLVIAAMRDRASVNSAAMHTVSILYNFIFDMGCFSHTIDHVGEWMNTPVLDKSWIGLFSQSKNQAFVENSDWTTTTSIFSNKVVEQIRNYSPGS